VNPSLMCLIVAGFGRGGIRSFPLPAAGRSRCWTWSATWPYRWVTGVAGSLVTRVAVTGW